MVLISCRSFQQRSGRLLHFHSLHKLLDMFPAQSRGFFITLCAWLRALLATAVEFKSCREFGSWFPVRGSPPLIH